MLRAALLAVLTALTILVERSSCEEELPPAAFNPWLSAELLRLLAVKHPVLLARLLATQPLSYDGLASSGHFYPRERLSAPAFTDQVLYSQPTGRYKQAFLL